MFTHTSQVSNPALHMANHSIIYEESTSIFVPLNENDSKATQYANQQQMQEQFQDGADADNEGDHHEIQHEIGDIDRMMDAEFGGLNQQNMFDVDNFNEYNSQMQAQQLEINAGKLIYPE